MELREQSYRTYADNLEQARIDQALKLERISNISVAQPATFQAKANWPKKTLLWGLGLIAGLLTGAGVALVAEYLDHSLKSERDLRQQLELIPLVCVPRLPRSRLTLVPRLSRERTAHANAG
jgi:capsular polysaccharide biosynthesis protein